MTAIEQYQDRSSVELQAHQTEAVHRLSEWASSAQAAYGVAEQLVKTSFVPEGFRGKPHEACAAILAGMECGLSPMAALRSFDVIQGQAAPRAITLRAVVQSYGHEMVLEESTATRCKMRGRRRGTHEWQTVVWTIDRAKSLNLLGKQNWKTQPQAMLVARATSELARLIAADAILGIGYTAEEVEDGAVGTLPITPTTTDDQPTPTPATGTKRMSRKKKDDPPPPADTDVVDAEVVDEPAVDMITDPQRRKMLASFNEHGLERDARLAYVADVIGRKVSTSNELTKVEASKVIDALETAAPTEESF